MGPRLRRSRVSIGIVVALMCLAASAASVAGSPSVKAVASFSILGDWVREIGDGRVQLNTLVGPDGDIHVFEPTPLDARAIADADIVFINGMGLEGWIGRLVKASGSRAVVVEASRGVATIAIRSLGGDPAAVDPHAWQDVRNAMIYVDNIARGLCDVDAAGCPDYRRNASRYRARLDALDHWIREEIGKVPPIRRRVITAHDAFTYFGRAYGITFLAPEGVSTESEPSAAGVAQLIRQIRRESASALFVENVSDPRLVEQIARETGLKPGGKLYSDALSPPGGGAGSYIEMMRHNVATVVSAIKGR
jgi:zinc/manganese transport system substrate-binding protein